MVPPRAAEPAHFPWGWAMSALTLAAVACLGVGLLLVLRAVAIVAGGGEGRFAFDVLISTLLGFGLIGTGIGLLQ